MNTVECIDMFTMSLPHNRLYCKFGDIVPNDNDDLVGDHPACMRHSADGSKSEKFAGAPKPNRDFRRTFRPIMNWDEHCDSFTPAKFGSEKFKVSDRCGSFESYRKSGEGE